MENFDTFEQEAKALGRIDYDHVYAYQCVDLILYYIYKCYGIGSGVAGNAIDYWNKPSGPLLAKFDKIATTDAIKGDIVVLNGLTGNPYGHIGIATGNVSATQIEILEQNGGDGDGDGTLAENNEIRTRFIDKVRVAGVLRPKANEVAAAAPAAPAPAATSTENTGKQLVLPASISSWHVYHPNGPYNLAAAVAVLDPAKYGGLTYDILGSPIKNFYLIQSAMYGQVAIYAGPDTVAVIQDKPAAAAPAAPAAAAPANPGGEHTLSNAVKGYSTANDAANHINWNGHTMVQPGTYSIFNQEAGVMDLTSKPGEPGSWINPADDVAPNPTPVQPTDITDVTEDVTITDTLRVRSGPSTQDSQVAVDGAPNGDLQKGDVVGITGYCHGENVSGNDIWLRSVKGNWFWSGATTFTVAQSQTVPDVTPAVATPAATSTPPVIMPPAPEAASTSVPVTVLPAAAPATTTVDGLQITPAPGLYVAKVDTTVTDLTGSNKPMPLKAGQVFQATEEIVKDGKIYLRDISAKKKGLMYVALKKDLKSAGVSLDGMKQFAQDMKQASEDDWDTLLNDLKNDTETPGVRQRVEADAKLVEKGFLGLFNRKKGK